MNKLIVISGCSSGGKSTLITELSQQGYSVMSEAGREVYRKYGKISDHNTPEDEIMLCDKIIEKNVANYHLAMQIKNPKSGAVFLDRCFLECINYYQNLGLNDSNKYDDIVTELRYFPTILMAPPWEDIYVNDTERQHKFETGVEEYKRLLIAYPQYGYELLELPLAGVKERVAFVLSMLEDD
jgi:predicted ATPase